MDNTFQAVRSSPPAVAVVIAAAAAVIILCGVGVAVLLGWVPERRSAASVTPSSPLRPAAGSIELGLGPGESIVSPTEIAAKTGAPLMPPYTAPAPPLPAPQAHVTPPPPVAAAPAYAPRPLSQPQSLPRQREMPVGAPAPVTPRYIRNRSHPTDPNDPWPN